MRENIDVFDVELTDEEMTRVAPMDTGGGLTASSLMRWLRTRF